MFGSTCEVGEIKQAPEGRGSIHTCSPTRAGQTLVRKTSVWTLGCRKMSALERGQPAGAAGGFHGGRTGPCGSDLLPAGQTSRSSSSGVKQDLQRYPLRAPGQLVPPSLPLSARCEFATSTVQTPSSTSHSVQTTSQSRLLLLSSPTSESRERSGWHSTQSTEQSRLCQWPDALTAREDFEMGCNLQ